ncbi:MAG: HNH endonuclease [Rhizobiales bacterium]|nr:HNH endonuclease [Hyphomicrobiales bacterium]
MTFERRDQRSEEAQRYRPWYKLAAWRKARVVQLQRQPLCERHLERGEIVAATVVNHRTPHRGDWSLFIDPSNHESTCKSCHDGPIQSAEVRGFSKAVDVDGWPIDPAHPVNR